MTHYTVKCPHCKYLLRATKTASGSPFGTCPRCEQPYIDRDCYEPALKPYKKQTTFQLLWISAWGAFFFGVGVMMVYYILVSLSSEMNFNNAVAAGLFVSAFCAATIFIFKKFNESRNEDDARALEEWKASDARLQNKEYALSVAKLGFDVPDRYLQKDTIPVNNENARSKLKPDNSVTYEVDKKYVSYLIENCPEITQREAELFCDVLVENAKNGKAAALRAFNDFAQNQIGDDPIHAICIIPFLCGALVPNKVVSKEESDNISKYYSEIYLSRLSRPIDKEKG